MPDVVAVSPEVTHHRPGHRQRTQLVHHHCRRVAGIPENPRLEPGLRLDVHRPRGAQRRQGRRHRFDKTAHELFGPLNPVGQTVRINNMPFVIIGLLDSKGAGIGGQNQDDRVIIPYTTAMKRITGDKYLRSMNLQIGEADRMAIAQEQITSLLRQRHRLLPAAPMISTSSTSRKSPTP